jgi:hypothetical protein
MHSVIRQLARRSGQLAVAAMLLIGGAAVSTPVSYASASKAPIVPNNQLTWTVCHPSQTNGNSAFPYTATVRDQTHLPPTCNAVFAWGFTVSGSATGQAEWDSPFVGPGLTCAAQAWVPDSHSNDPNAQYFIFDGSTYLANDAFINQGAITNTWSRLFNNTWFPISNHMRVTLSDHNPKGQAGWYIAAYAVQFLCLPG